MTYIPIETTSPYSVGYRTELGDGPVKEFCLYAGSSYEARVIAIQQLPELRANPNLIKYIIKEA